MRKFEKVSYLIQENITLPQRQTLNSAGYDLSAYEDITIEPGEIQFIPTGLKVKLGESEVLLVYPRSSLGIKKGLMMSNGVGVIDSDYYNNPQNEGHIMVPLYNFKNTPVTISKFERVAQGVFQTFLKTEDDQPVSSERKGGFGSSS
jgi:dUTP pyrophosphatase